MSPTPLALAPGAVQQLKAVGTFSDGSTLDITTLVTWRSTTKRVANVNAGGRVQAKKKGTTTINATRFGVTGSASVTAG